MVSKEYNLPYRVVHTFFDGRYTVESYHRTVSGARTAVKTYRAQTQRKNKYEIHKREIIESSPKMFDSLRAHQIENWSVVE